jgi:mono/diheme cytochrome c family protein
VEHFPDPAQEEQVIRKGRGAMPAWEQKLTDEQIAAVVRYTRESL